MELQLSTAETRSLRTTSLDRKKQQQQQQKSNGSLLSEAEFVTVVNVHGGPRQQRLQQQQQQQQSTDVVDGSSFVTVLSIGNGANVPSTASGAVDPAHPEEEVQVYRLPGERLGFGLKFEGGNKTSEKVRRLFIQSCAEQSPASRTTCSWGKLGEGDELLSIDGVPVTQLTRLDCVRRLKESQLVLRLLIRCRGALRPEVVSAERKDQHKQQQQQQQQQCKPSSPPELPTAPPPPVPPRKLRHHHHHHHHHQPQQSPSSSSSSSTVNRGLADGEASPGVKQAWDSPKSAGSSQTGSPLSQGSYRSAASSMKSSNYESCASSPTKNYSKDSSSSSSSSSLKPHASPVLSKAVRQELPTEAQAYLDARSHDGSSTQGSTSDDTSSSLSTVVDRCSVSDRFSTTSTISHTSDANQFHMELDNAELEINDHEMNTPLSNSINVLDTNNADFLLNRLANSEARTYVESRGDVERVTAVVAPNTVLIEETPALQPPLCFQDAPLSYGHEPRPSIFFTANLVADSRTHFRPIKDDAEIVDKVVNGEAPPLPVRNHVNRVPVNQQQQQQQPPQQHCQSAKEQERSKPNAPRPPKPMPRKEVKGKRKRPPPPPPPPRREPAPPVPEARNPNTINKIFDVDKIKEEDKNKKNRIESETINDAKINDSTNSMEQNNFEINQNIQEEALLEILKDKEANEQEKNIFEKCDSEEVEEIICTASLNVNKTDTISMNNDVASDENKTIEESVKSDSPLDTLEKSEEVSSDSETEIVENVDFCSEINNHQIDEEIMNEALSIDIDDHSLRVARTIRNIRAREIIEKEDIADESEEDCYWTSNLTTIGEEDETNSLEYENEITEEKQLFGSSMTADNGDKSCCSRGTAEQRASITTTTEPTAEDESSPLRDRQEDEPEQEQPQQGNENSTAIEAASTNEAEDKQQDKTAVNGNRMDNCGGGGQRLPPDGDEFPAAYQEFANNLRSSASNSSSSSVSQQQQQYQQYVESRAGGMTMGTTTTNGGNSGDHLVGESCVDGFIKSSSGLGGLLASLEKKDSSSATGSLLELDPDKRTSVSNYVLYSTHLQKSSMSAMEKKLDLANFYSKESGSEPESTTPPPLPLSMPPSGNGKQQQQQKAANNDLWRQDNMSEKSVKDKIAMFSSQASLDAPLFPCSSVKTTTTTTLTKKLVKHKSSEDVFGEEKRHSELLAPKSSTSPASSSPPTSYNSYTTSGSNSSIIGNGYSNGGGGSSTSSSSSSSFSNDAATNGNNNNKYVFSNGTKINCFSEASAKVSNNLTRATSFSGSATSLFSSSDRLQTSSEVLNSSSGSSIGNGGGFVSRTNSLVSTLKRPGEESKRSSLDQLIEQRRKGYSKLRGLVIPEKDAVPVDQPIIDLPEIKSRDSILMNQVPRSNIQDKWGSQSSLASNASTVSSSLRPGNNGLNNNNNSLNSSFKMPAPKILSSYSPAFKRKSLNIYSSTNQTSSSVLSSKTVTNNNNNQNNNNNNNNQQQLGSPASDAPKSLESICSPTRSDYSFDFVSSSTSPENNHSSNNGTSNNKPKLLGNGQRKGGRNEYDDSDNDSAVSSSQSSISRGFSPPMSPIPSDNGSHRGGYDSLQQYNQNGRSNQLIVDKSSPNYPSKTTTTKGHAPLKRTSSQETTASNASTLTASSQVAAGADTLSRRVLKPQSVEAINRKNILASARCRSGRDHNGSPLIQRKFSDDDEEQPINANTAASTANGNGTPTGMGNNKKQENGGSSSSRFVRMNGNGEVNKPQIKIAYIEITENAVSETEKKEVIEQKPRLPPKRNIEPKSVPIPAARPSKPDLLEASSDMKSWVKSEMRSFARNSDMVCENKMSIHESELTSHHDYRSKSSLTLNETTSSIRNVAPTYNLENDVDLIDTIKPKSRSLLTAKTSENDTTDLLTVLTTKSRSRSAIHVEDTSYGKLKNQMSLEDMLALKSTEAPTKLPRSQNGEMKSSLAVRRSSSSDSWAEDKMFPSKLTTPSASVRSSRESILDEESSNVKIPAPRNLGRRSASVTDMKKVFEKPEATSPPISGTSSPGGFLNNASSHNRFPSLDSSSVEDNMRPVGNSDTEQDRYSSEQFGSISSLASSTSLISQQELGQLLEEVNLEEPRGNHDIVVIMLHKENPSGSVGITLAGGVDCETKEITVHRVLSHSIADREGRIQRGDRVLSINGRSMRGLTHRESQAVLKQPRSEVVLVVSRAKLDDTGVRLRHRTESVETIVEGYETSGVRDSSAWGPPMTVLLRKDGAGLGFSLEGGRDSPLGDRPLLIKKIFTGGAADKTGSLCIGDQLLEVNQRDVTRMSRIEAWSFMKKLPDGEVNLLVRHPAIKSS